MARWEEGIARLMEENGLRIQEGVRRYEANQTETEILNYEVT